MKNHSKIEKKTTVKSSKDFAHCITASLTRTSFIYLFVDNLKTGKLSVTKKECSNDKFASFQKQRVFRFIPNLIFDLVS